MLKTRKISKICCLSLSTFLVNCYTALAQIEPDATLPNNSVVERSSEIITIKEGTQAGSNLFHSFEQFSILTNETVYFNNNLTIENIFSRVTGNLTSTIDGNIRANGTANIFLLNSNGIIFGPNVRLDLGGSFLASTANNIRFADGYQFSTDTSQPTLLTVSIPIGLGFDRHPKSINLQGNGSNLQLTVPGLFVGNPIAEPIDTTSGLKTAPGRVIALIGGEVTSDSSVIKAPSGRIEIGSVVNGVVNFSLAAHDSYFDYSNVAQFGDIKLLNKTLIEASGSPGGFIGITGKNVSLRNGATLLLSNFNTFNDSQIKVNATELLEIVGIEKNASDFRYGKDVSRGIISQNFSDGDGANILLNSKDLVLENFASISSGNFSSGRGGNIFINADNMSVSGLPPIPGYFIPASVYSITFNSGQAGNITLLGKNLLLKDGGLVLSQTNSTGRGGDISIDFLKTIKIQGYSNASLVFGEMDAYVPSVVGTTTASSGNAGTVSVTTPSLNISNGGRINSTTAASGNAGKITIQAPGLLDLEGRMEEVGSSEAFFYSQITSSAEQANSFLVSFFGIPPLLTGNSGDIDIQSNNILIRDDAAINAINQGSGKAGVISINSDLVKISNQGSVSTITRLGNGGDIFLRSQNLQLGNGSTISATAGLAGGGGNGGNITIDTDTLTALDRSSITANAFTGRGGNIQITTQGLFRFPDSIFSASSQFGVNGTVDVRTFGLEPDSALVPLNEIFIPTEQVVANSCLARRNKSQNRFVITGSGGLPESPNDSVMPMPLFSDRGLEQSLPQRSRSSAPTLWREGDPVVEATGIVKTKDGRTLLGMAGSGVPDAESAICR